VVSDVGAGDEVIKIWTNLVRFWQNQNLASTKIITSPTAMIVVLCKRYQFLY